MNKTHSAFVVVITIICAALILLFVGIARGGMEEPRWEFSPYEPDAEITIAWNAQDKSVFFYIEGHDFELLNLLERCREFINDYAEPLFNIQWDDGVFRNPSRGQHLDAQDRAEINKIQERIDRRSREIKLREDIEAVIKILTEIKEAK